MIELQEFAKKHKALFWDVSEKTIEKMDDTAIVERFFCYGSWEDYKQIEEYVTKTRAKEIFISRGYMSRTNLREETINLFTHYFHVTPPSGRTLSWAI